MKHFIVDVRPMSIRIDEADKEQKNCDAIAIVDGEQWRYTISKSKNIEKRSIHWQSRAFHNIQSHAKNGGTVVSFVEVHHIHPKTIKMSEKQSSLHW